MRLLALDTSEEACSAALLVDEQLVERFEIAPRRHSELILPMMDGLLTDAGLGVTDLDALAFARGPGSFTGVRIAASIVQGAALGADLPVVPVSSLQALAQGALREHGVEGALSALDARMNEVYWGTYRSDATGIMRAVTDEVVCAPFEVPVPGEGPWTGVGSGWSSYADVLARRCGGGSAVFAEARVHAQDVAVLARQLYREGAQVPAEKALPVYLRDEVAWARQT